MSVSWCTDASFREPALVTWGLSVVGAMCCLRRGRASADLRVHDRGARLERVSGSLAHLRRRLSGARPRTCGLRRTDDGESSFWKAHSVTGVARLSRARDGPFAGAGHTGPVLGSLTDRLP